MISKTASFLLGALLLAGVASATTAKHHAGRKSVAHSTKHRKGQKASTRRGSWKKHGQQSIREDRASQIQLALIREKYFDGEATGVWDKRTQEAMRRYQADNGWQSKRIPDSRALIKMGMGPSTEGLLNAEAMNKAPGEKERQPGVPQ